MTSASHAEGRQFDPGQVYALTMWRAWTAPTQVDAIAGAAPCAPPRSTLAAAPARHSPNHHMHAQAPPGRSAQTPRASMPRSGHPESNQGPSDCCKSLQSDALPTEL